MILRGYTECLRKSIQSIKLDELNSLSCGLNGALLLEVQERIAYRVFTINQNVKTMIDAINLKTLTNGSEIELNDYKDCINYILCRKSTTDCFLLKCRKCPKMKEFSELVTGLLEKKIK